MIVLLDNHGYACIGALSRSVGSAGFGTRYRAPSENGRLDARRRRALAAATPLPVDLAANAASLGVACPRAATLAELRAALSDARRRRPVVRLRRDRSLPGVPSYDGWWDVPVAEVPTSSGRAARERYEQARAAQRAYLAPPLSHP